MSCRVGIRLCSSAATNVRYCHQSDVYSQGQSAPVGVGERVKGDGVLIGLGHASSEALPGARGRGGGGSEGGRGRVRELERVGQAGTSCMATPLHATTTQYLA